MLITAMSTLGRLAAIAGLTSIMYMGCGTSHQFLPGMPLEKKEWMISVVWHYDMNRLARPGSLILPEVNAYVGIGKNYNLGFGASSSLILLTTINHLSLAKYYPRADDTYWAGYIHLNRILSMYSNPHFELGAVYGKDYGSLRQNLSLGMAFGQSRFWSKNCLDYTGFQGMRGIMPVFKYSLYGRNAGLSWSHYQGQTRTAILASFPDLFSSSDTLVALSATQVDSIAFFYDLRYSPVILATWGLFLETGDTVALADEYCMTDVASPVTFYCVPPAEFRYWSHGEYEILSVNNERAVVSIDSIIARWQAGEDIVITRYPQELVDRVKNLPSWKVDNSFGWAITAFTDWK